MPQASQPLGQKLATVPTDEHTCLMVTAGRQSLSSSNNDKHTVPDGYTFGWNIGGSNLPA